MCLTIRCNSLGRQLYKVTDVFVTDHKRLRASPVCFRLQTSSGAVHIHETRQKFLEGALHPANILMCPHTCVTNLPQPRQKHPGKILSHFTCTLNT